MMSKGLLNLEKLLDENIELPTDEEYAKIKEENYTFNKNNPNNFSKWFEPLATSLGSEFKIPSSVVVELPLKVKTSFEKDYGHVTEEDKGVFHNYLEESEALQSFLVGKDEVFIKSGVFSNKFDFDASCHVTDLQNLYNNLYSITYAAALYGANQTNELVLREYISNIENKPTIYNGMPLRTEFRVFYDFDKDEIIGVANYWHPDEMLRSLLPYELRKSFGEDEKGTPLETQIALAKAAIEVDKEPFRISKYKQFICYAEYMPQLISEFDKWKKFVEEKVEKSLKGSEVLTGQWSIDIMKNGEEFYFIDAAIMQQSALVKYIEYKNTHDEKS